MEFLRPGFPGGVPEDFKRSGDIAGQHPVIDNHGDIKGVDGAGHREGEGSAGGGDDGSDLHGLPSPAHRLVFVLHISPRPCRPAEYRSWNVQLAPAGVTAGKTFTGSTTLLKEFVMWYWATQLGKAAGRGRSGG